MDSKTLNELFENTETLTDFSVVESPSELEQKWQSFARQEMSKHGLEPHAYIARSNHPDSEKWDRIGGCCVWGADDPTPVIFLNWMNLQIFDPSKLEYLCWHEVAHAIAGDEAHHGDEWIRAALELGDGIVLHAGQLYTENGLRQYLGVPANA